MKRKKLTTTELTSPSSRMALLTADAEARAKFCELKTLVGAREAHRLVASLIDGLQGHAKEQSA
jgi:hypothetical protein